MPLRRPTAAVTSLPALSHSAMPRDVATLLSPCSPAPRTPTKRADAVPPFPINTNRNSTDSWNSSNYDGGDDLEWEWKPEHIMMLTRTLDALPGHILTPFNGPVPPSNLLDKIARGVIEAKGRLEWPHSLRSTRAKIVELARSRAQNDSTITEEESTESGAALKQTTNIGHRVPLHRQSSMDFMRGEKVHVKDNPNISRLSRRLQKADRILSTPSHRSYARSPSPPRFGHSLNPSTPSSGGLTSGILDANMPHVLKRSISSTSSASGRGIANAVDSRLQRIRKSETYGDSSIYGSGLRSLKRAPSYGSSRNSCNSLDSAAMAIDFNARETGTASDEEEKLRVHQAKRARKKTSTPTTITPPLTSPIASATVKARPKPSSKNNTAKAPHARSSRPAANLQRNPSIFGPELPCPQPNLEPPTYAPPVPPKDRQVMPSYVVERLPESSYLNMSSNPYTLTSIPPVTPSSQPKSHRRARPTAPLPRASLPRKISFSSLAPMAEETATGGAGIGLDSAFQLH